MVSGTILKIRPSLVVSLSTTTANDDGSGDYADHNCHKMKSAAIYSTGLWHSASKRGTGEVYELSMSSVMFRDDKIAHIHYYAFWTNTVCVLLLHPRSQWPPHKHVQLHISSTLLFRVAFLMLPLLNSPLRRYLYVIVSLLRHRHIALKKTFQPQLVAASVREFTYVYEHVQ